MTIQITDQLRRVQYVGTGTGPYQGPFEILEQTDIEVYKDATLLTLTTDYTVTINADGTFSVTTVASMTGFTVTIAGARPYARITDFSTGGDFRATTVNDEFDSLQIQILQILEVFQRSVRAAVTDATDLDMTLPVAATRASKYLGFNADGEPVALPGTDETPNAMLVDTEDQALTGGVVVTSKSLGTITSGTVTPDPGDRPQQHYTNGGAHTLGVSANAGSILLDITNDGSAGAITTSAFTKVTGDAFTTTNGHKFRCHVSIGNGGSLLSVQALQ